MRRNKKIRREQLTDKHDLEEEIIQDEEIKQLTQAEQEIERGEYQVYKSSKDLFKAIETEHNDEK